MEVLKQEHGKAWSMYQGDCCEVLDGIPDNSIHYSIFSPPFSSLYTYSNSERDLGNNKDYKQFARHMRFLAEKLFRVMKLGRNVSIHCMDLPLLKERDGIIGLRDFRGHIIRIFERAGFVLHSQVTIWKNPVQQMQRTKALGLLHKQLKKDSVMSRQGLPDYLVTFRKPGVNDTPCTNTNESFPVAEWQEYASPVWMDIKMSNTLQYRAGRSEDDERHICPLQLDVIERGIRLWSTAGDTVLTPFMGIGSEVYQAVKMGRRAIGIELKESYFDLSVKNVQELGDLEVSEVLDILAGVEIDDLLG